jgi:SAM-dependent MidA family methyltransferase
VDEPDPITWRHAMARALYGEDGLYLSAGAPGRHFRTSAHAGSQWVAAIHTLAARVDDALGAPHEFTVVDMGAGGGELLTGLAGIAPERWSLLGVDRAPRPESLPARVQWRRELGDRVVGLLVAAELLDVVPVDVAVRTEGGVRLLTVTATGAECPGDPVTGRDREWLTTWWPLTALGSRAEIGWPRDDAWRSLTGRLGRGAAVAIDYSADPGRDLAGTLAAYRDGRQTAPAPDARSDLTAHVLFESLVDVGDVVISQREALRGLGIGAGPARYAGDAVAYLNALSEVGATAELTDPGGLGGFTWLVHSAGIDQPI